MEINKTTITNKNEMDFRVAGLMYFFIFSFVVAMTYLTPIQLDDLAFINLYLEHSEGNDGISLKGIIGFFQSMRENDNSRISNQLAPIFALVTPFKQLFPLFNGLCICGIIWIISKWCGAPRHPFFILCLWFAMVVFLPWRNQLFCQDYALNYIFAGFITLFNIYILFKYEREGWTGIRFFVAILLSILAGGWHEGFAIPTLTGLFVYGVVNKMKKSQQWYVIVSIYLLSAIIFGLSEGMINRAIKEQTSPMTINYFKLTADLILPIISYVALLIMLIFKKASRFLISLVNDSIVQIFFVASIISFLLSIVFDHTARTSFYPVLSTIIVWSVIITKNKTVFLSKKIKQILSIILFLVWSFQAISSIVWQYRLYKDNDNIMKDYREYKNSTIFYDIVMPEKIPLYTLYFPSKSIWVTTFQFKCLGDYLHNENVAVVPTALKNASTSNSRSLGNHFFEKNGAIFTDKDYFRGYEYMVFFNIKMKNGMYLYDMPSFSIPYQNEFGENFYYYKIFKQSGSEIQSISINRIDK